MIWVIVFIQSVLLLWLLVKAWEQKDVNERYELCINELQRRINMRIYGEPRS